MQKRKRTAQRKSTGSYFSLPNKVKQKFDFPMCCFFFLFEMVVYSCVGQKTNLFEEVGGYWNCRRRKQKKRYYRVVEYSACPLVLLELVTKEKTFKNQFSKILTMHNFFLFFLMLEEFELLIRSGFILFSKKSSIFRYLILNTSCWKQSKKVKDEAFFFLRDVALKS